MYYLKQAPNPGVSADIDTAERVRQLLKSIEQDGEDAVRRLNRELDGWEGDILLSPADLEASAKQVPETVQADLRFAHDRVRDFAMRQRDSMVEFEVESAPGVIVGQRLIPVQTAGCYVPGGRYAHAASAIMSVATARVAGVENVIAATPAHGEQPPHPAILYAMSISGVSSVLVAGGVQGIGALAYGIGTGQEADVIVGPGNRYVAEAKRQLFGRVGIDVIAGPTENLIIADETANADVIAMDLAGQAEHGSDSPVWLITTSKQLGAEVIGRIDSVIEALPEPARGHAANAWRDFGEVVVVADRDEACEVSDRYAAEHLQVQAADLDWWLGRLKNYGSLFLGEETTVAFGDKCSGPNHILPTRRAARYSGGLSVGKFIKVLSHQRMDRQGSSLIAPVAARISRLEGMEGHARTADMRIHDTHAGQDHTSLRRDLGEPPPIPPDAQRRVRRILERGYLTRYGEFGGDESEVALLERDFAAYLGARYAVAVNSGGSALYLALLCAGVTPGDRVLLNAFTLAPVPGAIAHAGGVPLLVECDERYTIDFEDLRRKINRGASVLMLSHMRGHIADMDVAQEICRKHNVTMIEDCAHTLGAKWNGTMSGRFGKLACFSFQSYKHINAGEGGMLVTDDEDMAARAILYSGSYMLYGQNGAAPPEEVFARHRESTPNLSMRMTEITAAVARPQIALLDERGRRWNESYETLAKILAGISHVEVPPRNPQEQFIASSIQFSLSALSAADISRVVDLCAARGVGIKWFGRDEATGFTSNFEHWGYVGNNQDLDRTRSVLASLCDMRIPLSLTTEDCRLIGDIISDSIDKVQRFRVGPPYLLDKY